MTPRRKADLERKKTYYGAHRDELRAKARARYKKNSDAVLEYQRNYHKTEKGRATADRRRQKRIALMKELKEKPCADCGEQYPYYVMDLDHRPDEIKVCDVSRLHREKDIRAEAAKCDVVCANCHRERSQNR